MYLEIVKKDITTISSDFLICHCISADAAMGAGVALALVRRFPSVNYHTPKGMWLLFNSSPDSAIRNYSYDI